MENHAFLDRIKQHLELKLYPIMRKYYLNSVMKDYGHIVEDDEKIICYVEQKKLDKNGRENYGLYKLNLYGMNTGYAEAKKLIDYFHLNKPVYYIFDHIEFKTGLEFSAGFSHVHFQNCIFHKNIGVFWADEITFENNTYFDSCNAYFFGNCFLYGNIDTLIFKNEKFINHRYEPLQYDPSQFGMNLHVKNLKLIQSKIQINSPASFHIKAKRTEIYHSEIDCAEIDLESDSIVYDNLSSIHASNRIMIKNKEEDFIGGVYSPIVIYNGIDLSNAKRQMTFIDKDSQEKHRARQKIVRTLQAMRDSCNQNLENITNEFQKNTLSRVLRKKKGVNNGPKNY